MACRSQIGTDVTRYSLSHVCTRARDESLGDIVSVPVGLLHGLQRKYDRMRSIQFGRGRRIGRILTENLTGTFA